MDSYVVVGRPWEGHLHSNQRDELRGFTHANVALRQIFVRLLGLRKKVPCLDWVGNVVATHGCVRTFDRWPRWDSRSEVPLMFIFHFHDPFVLCFFWVGGGGKHPQSEQKDQLPCFCWSRGSNCFFLGGRF